VTDGFECWGISPTTQFVYGVLGWSSLFSHPYKRCRGCKKFFPSPQGVSEETCPAEKKIFGLYIGTYVTLGRLGGLGIQASSITM